MPEPDLTCRLSHLAERPVATSGLPAEEVRRRGDRLRRHRQAMTAVGAAAAVAVIATTGAFAGGAFDRAGSPQPAPPAPTSWAPSPDADAPGPLDEIPATFPIAAGLGDPTDVTESPLLADRLTWCVDLALSDFSLVDSLSAEHAGGETSEVRTLLLFGERARAAAAEEALVSAAEGCPYDGDPEVRREPAAASPDWPGATLIASFPAESGGTAADILHVVRSGPAVLLSSSYRTPDAVAATRADLVPVMTALAELTGEEPAAPSEDAPTSPEPLDPTGPREIPDDFPLATGWPDSFEPGRGPSGKAHGPDGPDRTLAPTDIAFCGSRGTSSTPRDRLRADWTNVEDFRQRELVTWPDAAEAVAYVATLRALARTCPVEDRGDGFTAEHRVRRTAEGGESWAIVTTYRFDGTPAMGLDVLHVIRLGRAVLLDTTAAHGGVGPDPEAEITGRVEAMADASAPVVAAMCRFTEAGC